MDKVILAKNVVLDGGLGSSRPNDNQMILGGTGTGKSMSHCTSDSVPYERE